MKNKLLSIILRLERICFRMGFKFQKTLISILNIAIFWPTSIGILNFLICTSLLPNKGFIAQSQRDSGTVLFCMVVWGM